MSKEEQRILILVDNIKNNCYEVAEKCVKDYKKEIYNQALEELAEKLKSKPYWDDEHNFQAIPIDYIDEVLEEITIK